VDRASPHAQIDVADRNKALELLAQVTRLDDVLARHPRRTQDYCMSPGVRRNPPIVNETGCLAVARPRAN
jgi:hypothetical protein